MQYKLQKQHIIICDIQKRQAFIFHHAEHKIHFLFMKQVSVPISPQGKQHSPDRTFLHPQERNPSSQWSKYSQGMKQKECGESEHFDIDIYLERSRMMKKTWEQIRLIQAQNEKQFRRMNQERKKELIEERQPSVVKKLFGILFWFSKENKPNEKEQQSQENLPIKTTIEAKKNQQFQEARNVQPEKLTVQFFKRKEH